MGKLLKVFADCEDLDDEESLQVLCHIFKAIVGLNDGTLLEVRGDPQVGREGKGGSIF